MRFNPTILVAAIGCGQSSTTDTQVCNTLPHSTQVGVTHGTVKIRDASPVPPAATISLDAARNEAEPFQIVVNGGTAGVSDLHVTKAALISDTDPSVSLAVTNMR